MLTPSPTLADFLGLFPQAKDVASFEVIPAEALPAPYQQLLNHTHHMTVAVENHYGVSVSVRVVETQRDGDEYSRRIVLVNTRTQQVVQYGCVNIDLAKVTPAVRLQIEAGETPLGRILITHDVLRRIEPVSFLKVFAGPDLVELFGLPGKTIPLYGRIGVIFTDDHPAIDVLEILAPVS